MSEINDPKPAADSSNKMAGSTKPEAAPLDTTPAAESSSGKSARPGSWRSAGNGLWIAVALLCVAIGSVGSLLGAHALAHTNAESSRQAFKRTSASIASTLTLATQREEDLALGAATFFAAHPHATPTEFSAWAKWTHPLGSYPELERLGLIALVRAPELAAFKDRIAGRSPKQHSASHPATATTAAGTAAPSTTAATAKGAFHCLAVAGLARGLTKYPPVGLDYCEQVPGLLRSRGTGLRAFVPVSSGATGTALGIETPVYRGGVTPKSTAGRRAAFVGWLHEVLAPSVALKQALSGQPGIAARLSYHAGATSFLTTSGVPRKHARSTTVTLHNGWSATIFGASTASGVLDDGQALALLIAGILLSILLGMLAYDLGASRPQAPAPPPPPAQPRHEQLYDALTGLPNRALTLDLAQRVIARTSRQSGMLAGALLIDIDWFKDVNEKLGHTAGDQALKALVERLEGVVRTGDTVGRLDGDQFVVLVESQARGIRLDSLARRVIEALHAPVDLDDFGPSFVLTASIGVAFGRYQTPQELLRDAQLALKASKAAGKDRYTLFNANMRSVTEGHGMLEVDLNTALQDGQLFLLYQPIQNLNNQSVVGMEALIRWRHPKQGVLAPEDFIPIAEETGLIVPIGRWVLEEACARAAAWNVAGHRAGISVTVSANQLNRDGFATDVRRALQQSGLAPSLLALEISEATVMLDVPAFGERVRELKQLGVRVAIDDFGNGYAYRSALGQMPLDYIKVDRSALAPSEDEDYRGWLLEAILHFGREASLTVIAKGVETAEQLGMLREMGCKLAQGHFIGEPVPADTVETLIAGPLATAPANANGQPL